MTDSLHSAMNQSKSPKRDGALLNAKNSYEDCQNDVPLHYQLDAVRANERQAVIKEIKIWLLGMMSGQKVDNGHECYDSLCEYCENAIKDNLLDELRADLVEMKEGK